MQNSLLNTKNLKKSFQEGKKQHVILHDITIAFEQNRSYAVTGVSGTGKSTLIQLLAGLDSPSKGAVLFNGRRVHDMTEAEHNLFLQKNVGLLFQSPYLLKEFTVLENCMIPALIAGTLPQNAQNDALHLLDQVGLTHKKEAMVGTLSGGQQARVALARALMNKPDFLLADEPTGNLDEKTGKEIVQLLLALKKEWKIGLIISTHDAYVADAMEFQYVLHNGLIEIGQ